MAGLNLNTTPPAVEPQGELENTGNDTLTGNEVRTDAVIPDQVQTPQADSPKVDEFFENFNKRYGTQFQADDDIKNVLGLPKKVTEYEAKAKESESLVKSIEDYKKKIEELEGSADPLKYFSSPETYIAEQLRIKYPKSNPVLLQEIATTDVNKMGDLDVLVKDKQLFVPDAPKEQIIRAVVLKKYGIDPTSPPEEWDEVSAAEMKLDAASAREKINGLKSVIELPKVITKEQKEQAMQEARVQREHALAPLKENFIKYDKFTQDGLEFDVPDEYKSKLPDMWKAMVMDAGLEPTQENIESIMELREALLLRNYFPKIKEIIAKAAKTELEKAVDAELHNDQPPNTKTASDDGHNQNTLPGLGQFLQDQGFRKY